MRQCQVIVEVRYRVVVGIHVLSHVPALACAAVAILLHNAITMVRLSPPTLVAFPAHPHIPSLPLRRFTGA